MAFFRRKKFRSFRRGRFGRRNPYDVQRFNLCGDTFFVGSGNCQSSTTDMIPFLWGNTVADTVGFGQGLLPIESPSIHKGMVFGGARFWLDWRLNMSQVALDEGVFDSGVTKQVWPLNLRWFIAKVPLDPETLGPVYVPDLWDPSISIPSGTVPSNTGDVQYDLLWTMQEQVICAIVQGQSQVTLLGNKGQLGILDSAGTFNSVLPPAQTNMSPYRCRMKRRVEEMSAIFFGVSSHSAGLATSSNRFDYTIQVNLYGQAAVKVLK